MTTTADFAFAAAEAGAAEVSTWPADVAVGTLAREGVAGGALGAAASAWHAVAVSAGGGKGGGANCPTSDGPKKAAACSADA